MDVRAKRVYEAGDSDDGMRVLVDRLWPRGISKEDAALDEWNKDVAPSSELRTSWHAEQDPKAPEQFQAFAESYREELRQDPAAAALDDLIERAQSVRRLTLLYGAKDTEINHAVVLREVLLERAAESS